MSVAKLLPSSLSLSRWQLLVLSMLGGALFPLAFAPVDWPWLAMVSLVLLGFVWQQSSVRQAAIAGALWGLAAFGVGVSWVHVAIRDFGQAPLALSLLLTGGMVLVLALFPAGVGALLVRWFRPGWPRVVAFAPLWVLGEFLRGHLFSGFPWLFAGYSQTDTMLAVLLPSAGVYGASLAVALAAAGVLIALQGQTGATRRYYTRAVVILLTVVLLTPLPTHTPRTPMATDTKRDTVAAPSLTVALIQANVEQQLKWQPEQLNRILHNYRELTLPMLGKVDAVIWPEAAIPAFAHNLGDYFPALAQAASASNTALVTGLPVLEADGRYYNAIVGFGRAGGRYDKRQLVPFGEYVPFQSMLRGLFAFFNLPMSGFSAGTRGQLLHVAGQPMAGAVCYEIAYPELVRDNVRALNGGAGYLLTVSNDAWFGRSWGPWQHLQIARTRALENGLPVIRATVTGVSAVIAPDGRILSQLPQFERAILRTTVNAAKPDTLWVKWGLLPVSIFLVLLLGIAIGLQWRISRS